MSDRLPWILCALAGLAVIALASTMGGIEGMRACDGDDRLGAVIRFEWVTSVAEVRDLFGEEPCRSTLAAAMDRLNQIDVAAFIPAFTLFQLFAAWALRDVQRGLASAAAVAALVACFCDLAEDWILFSITAALPGNQEMIDPLFWFVRGKFALLAVAAICLGLLLARIRGVSRWLGAAMIVGGAIGLAGLAAPRLLGTGIGLASTALLIGAVWNFIRSQLPQAQGDRVRS